jgi:hypothetical protein
MVLGDELVDHVGLDRVARTDRLIEPGRDATRGRAVGAGKLTPETRRRQVGDVVAGDVDGRLGGLHAAEGRGGQDAHRCGISSRGLSG